MSIYPNYVYAAIKSKDPNVIKKAAYKLFDYTQSGAIIDDFAPDKMILDLEKKDIIITEQLINYYSTKDIRLSQHIFLSLRAIYHNIEQLRKMNYFKKNSYAKALFIVIYKFFKKTTKKSTIDRLTETQIDNRKLIKQECDNLLIHLSSKTPKEYRKYIIHHEHVELRFCLAAMLLKNSYYKSRLSKVLALYKYLKDIIHEAYRPGEFSTPAEARLYFRAHMIAVFEEYKLAKKENNLDKYHKFILKDYKFGKKNVIRVYVREQIYNIVKND